MNNPENWFHCSVCEKRTRFCYLKAQLCRACAAFYRRATTEHLKYMCPFDGKCKLTGSRSYCRSCRYNKCRQMGATLNRECEENDKLDVLPEKFLEEAKLVVPHFPCKHSKLFDLLSGYDSFLCAQRLLVFCSHPEIELSSEKLIEARSRSTIIKTEKDSLPMMLQMFHDYYLPFSRLEPEKQIEIAARVGFEFFSYHKAFLTYQKFPEHDDVRRIVVSNGHYTLLTKENAEKYMDGVVIPGKIDEFIQTMEPVVIKRCLNFRDFKRLNLSKRDTVCMIFMTVFKYLEYCNLIDDQMQRYRDGLFEEWYLDLKGEFGVEEANKRFGKIMSYFWATDDLCNTFKNTLIMLGISSFYSHTEQLYDYQACLKYLTACKKFVN